MKLEKAFLRNQLLCAFISFLLPASILFCVYLSIGIYWGSARSILASDAFSQYANFHASFNNVLHGRQGIFYTWNAALGLNYFALISYYLGGIFTPFVFFFENKNIPDALYLLTIIKVGAMGLSFWFFAKSIYQKLPKVAHLLLSTSYALMSFAIAQSELITWLDAFIWLPLVILGIQRTLEKKGNTLLYISYFLVFVSNFYFGYMIGIYSFLFFLVKVFSDFSAYRSRIMPYLRTATLAVSSSMVMILPIVFDLQANGESFSAITQVKTDGTGVFDLIMKNFIGAYDTTKYGSTPFIYIGLLPFALMFFYFLSKQVNWREKLGFSVLLLFLLASFYFQWLNLAWQGFHSPNMFLFRFAFLFSFTILYLGGLGLEHFNQKEIKKIFVIFGGLIAIFSLSYAIVSNDYAFVTTPMLVITLTFLLAYLIIFVVSHQLKWATSLIIAVLFGFTTIEASLNTYGMINGIWSDWNYASRALYSAPHADIQALVDTANQRSDTFFRLENLDPISPNDSLNFGYSGVSFFSSIRNRHSSSFLNLLGFKSTGTNLNIRYANNTLLMDSLLGIKYNITKSSPLKYGFDFIDASGEFRLYQNQNALPLGFMTSASVLDFQPYKADNLSNQTALMNALSEHNEQYFHFIEPIVETSNNMNISTRNDGRTIFSEIEKEQGKSITFYAEIPANTQAYFSLFPVIKPEGKVKANITIDGITQQSQLNISGQYFNLGYSENTQKIVFTVEFTGTPTLTIEPPKILLLDTQAMNRAIETIRENAASVTHTNQTATFSINSTERDALLYTTIPYDKGWRAQIDGKPAEITNIHNAFIGVKVPFGEHTVTLTFLPTGFLTGLALFFGGLVLFIILENRKIWR